MFKGLRLRLTFLYLVIAAAFAGLMMFGTRQLVARFFQNTTDLALRYRMAQQFVLLDLPLTPELEEAALVWSERRAAPTQTSTSDLNPLVGDKEKPNQESHEEDEGDSYYHDLAEELYDADLASIYTLPLDQSGNVLAASVSSASRLPPNLDAVKGAIQKGHDLRTIELADGTPVRLLTYAVPVGEPNPAFLQLGRLLNDQQRALNQLVIVMAGMSSAMLLVVSLGSWWLAGRSISPAEGAWEKQQTFIANAGHELRTPLTLIRANTEVTLRHMAPDDSRRAMLEDILQETGHMADMVTDLLTLSRLDTGSLKLELQPILVDEILRDLRRQVEALAAERGVSITIASTAGTVLGDLTRLRQVLLILFDNALGYTPSGGMITFSSEVNGSQVQILVDDTGPGIPPEDLEHVFERFYQVEPGGRSGSGLGLAIARSLTVAMGGRLELFSSAEQGTTASLTMPAVLFNLR
ncbi:MAG: ATP-binding protein [Anaerolineales bacterium]|jgi:signal transduction histidine kinase